MEALKKSRDPFPEEMTSVSTASGEYSRKNSIHLNKKNNLNEMMRMSVFFQVMQ